MLIHDLVNEYWRKNRNIRTTTKGWSVGNAVCCHHRGHNKDTRSRGNFLNTEDGTMVTNCYNCGFKARYSGGNISHNFETWMGYLGIPKSKIQEAKLEILTKKIEGESEIHPLIQWFKPEEFLEIELPEFAQPIEGLLNENINDADFIECVNYLKTRGRSIETGWDYHWTPSKKWNLNKRIIIPFRYKGKIVGWTARFCGQIENEIPRYYNSDIPEGYLFNGEIISKLNRKFVIVVEGPFDAIAIDGVGALGSKLNNMQIEWLNSTDKEKIILPDLQRKNQTLIDIALKQGWSVSFPEWEEDIKDAADAQVRYGQLYTLSSIILSRTTNHLKIDIKRKMLRE